jgi:hypothetical protein
VNKEKPRNLGASVEIIVTLCGFLMPAARAIGAGNLLRMVWRAPGPWQLLEGSLFSQGI